MDTITIQKTKHKLKVCVEAHASISKRCPPAPKFKEDVGSIPFYKLEQSIPCVYGGYALDIAIGGSALIQQDDNGWYQPKQSRKKLFNHRKRGMVYSTKKFCHYFIRKFLCFPCGLLVFTIINKTNLTGARWTL